MTSVALPELVWHNDAPILCKALVRTNARIDSLQHFKVTGIGAAGFDVHADCLIKSLELTTSHFVQYCRFLFAESRTNFGYILLAQIFLQEAKHVLSILDRRIAVEVDVRGAVDSPEDLRRTRCLEQGA
jgi:hypothetical protein